MSTAQERVQVAVRALETGAAEERVAAAHQLAASGESAALHALLGVLASTADPALRHAVALDLSDRRTPDLFPALVRLLQDDRTSGSRGTLLHALTPFDCSHIVPLLVELFATGGLEVRVEAFNRLMETDAELSCDEWERLVERLRRLAQNGWTDPEDLDMLRQLFEALDADPIEG